MTEDAIKLAASIAALRYARGIIKHLAQLDPDKMLDMNRDHLDRFVELPDHQLPIADETVRCIVSLLVSYGLEATVESRPTPLRATIRITGITK